MKLRLSPPASARRTARFAPSVIATLVALVSAPGLVAQSSAGDTLAELKQLSVEELMEVEVTSVSRRPEKLSETAAAIQVVNGNDIRRSGASSLPEALRGAGTLHVAQRGASAWSISARGFNTELANKLLVMIDGRAVYTPLFSGVFWQRQDYLLEDIDRIEVVSGPGSTLWGANAVNGVISISTRRASETHGLYVEAGTGTELRRFGAVRYGGEASAGVHYRVYGKYAEGDETETGSGAEAADAWDMRQGGFRVDVEREGQPTLTFQGDAYERRAIPGSMARESGGNLLGRWTRAGTDGSELSLQGYYDRTRLVLPTAPFVVNGIPLAPAGVLRDDLATFDLDFQHRLPASERHHLVWGLGARFTRNRLENSPALAFVPASLDQWLWSAFAQDEIHLREDLKLTLGSKFEHNDYTGFEVEPGARIEWHLPSNRLLWAAVSRAVRMPSRIDRDVSQPGPGLPIILLKGGPDFDSETVVAWEAGIRLQPGARTAIALSAFHNEYRRLRSTDATPVTIIPLFFANDLEGTTSGFEAVASLQATAYWQLHASATFLESDLHVVPGAFDFNNALNETADPRWQLGLRSGLDLPRGWSLDLAFRWIDAFTANNAGVGVEVGSYAELDARLGWRVNDRLELSLSGRNLLHDRHAEYGLPGPGRAEVERNFHAKASWRF